MSATSVHPLPTNTNRIAVGRLQTVLKHACSSLNILSGEFVVCAGGEVYQGDGTSNHYITVSNNSSLSRNTKQAIAGKLVKVIFEARIEKGVEWVRIRQWCWDRDWQKDWQVLYDAPVSQQSMTVLSEMFIYWYRKLATY